VPDRDPAVRARCAEVAADRLRRRRDQRQGAVKREDRRVRHAEVRALHGRPGQARQGAAAVAAPRGVCLHDAPRHALHAELAHAPLKPCPHGRLRSTNGCTSTAGSGEAGLVPAIPARCGSARLRSRQGASWARGRGCVCVLWSSSRASRRARGRRPRRASARRGVGGPKAAARPAARSAAREDVTETLTNCPGSKTRGSAVLTSSCLVCSGEPQGAYADLILQAALGESHAVLRGFPVSAEAIDEK